MTGLGHLDPDLVWGHHLLLLGPDTPPGDVEALALSRFAGASRRDSHTIDLLPGAWLTGPWAVDDHARTALSLPGTARAAFVARSPVHRAGPVPQELRGLGGLLDAFADGTPEGPEAEVVDFLVAAARRLRGQVRVGGTGTVVRVDTEQFIDLIVYSHAWLEPGALTALLDPVLPGIELLPQPVHAPLPRPPEPADGLDDEEIARLHARAEQFDAAALASAPVTDGYGALWRFPDDGVISVHVENVEVVPTVLAGSALSDASLHSYSVRWYPADDGHVTGAGETYPPSTPPAHARFAIEACAAALVAAVGGAVTDDDGFLVEL